MLKPMLNIPVKIEGIERRKRSTGLFHIVAGFFLIANAGRYNELMNYQNLLIVIPIYLVALISLIYGFMRKRIDPNARYNHWVRLMQFLVFAVLGLLMISWTRTVSVLSLFLWAGVTILLLFTERKVFHDTALALKEDGVHIPGYLKHHILPWNLIEDLVLRPDYVTILRKDKKFVQLELLSAMNPQEIDQINQYSKSQIAQFSQQNIET
jgi:hypothetical protein